MGVEKRASPATQKPASRICAAANIPCLKQGRRQGWHPKLPSDLHIDTMAHILPVSAHPLHTQREGKTYSLSSKNISQNKYSVLILSKQELVGLSVCAAILSRTTHTPLVTLCSHYKDVLCQLYLYRSKFQLFRRLRQEGASMVYLSTIWVQGQHWQL